MDYCYLSSRSGEDDPAQAGSSERALARLACVRLMARRLGVPADAARFDIVSKDGLGRGVRPMPFYLGRPLPFDVSISHVPGAAIATLAMCAGDRVGVDLTPIGDVGRGTLLPWLTATERHLLGEEGPPRRGLLAALWAGKEASYKALQRGEAFDPARTEVARLEDGSWQGRFAGRRCALRFLTLDAHILGFAEWHREQ